jgi:hypothetical protein
MPKRPANDNSELARIMSATRDLVTQAGKLLRVAVPDTFLGRKTQEPFPKESADGADSNGGGG